MCTEARALPNPGTTHVLLVAPQSRACEGWVATTDGEIKITFQFVQEACGLWHSKPKHFAAEGGMGSGMLSQGDFQTPKFQKLYVRKFVAKKRL